MSKRQPVTASKHARSPKIAAKAHRANQVIVRSPKDSRLRSVAAGSAALPPKPHNDSKQEAPLVENPASTLQDVSKQTMRNNDSNKGFDFSSATANMRAYQEKLLELAQPIMHFAIEFAHSLATVRSSVEILLYIEVSITMRNARSRKLCKYM